ncbi:MAG: hypothetical protein WDO24_27810 [Pseudomonadota bacterium]
MNMRTMRPGFSTFTLDLPGGMKASELPVTVCAPCSVVISTSSLGSGRMIAYSSG